MTRLRPLAPLILAAALTVPTWASAAVDLSMEFKGVAGDTASGTVSPYLTAGGITSFAGEPVDITVSIAGELGDLYVSGFTASWSDRTYALPFLTHLDGAGFPNTPENIDAFGFFSTVSLDANGGSIHIIPTSGYVSAVDGDASLDFSFTYSTPQDPLGSFTDNAATGSGTFDDFLTFLIDPVIGPYDADSAGPFTISSVSQTAIAVPEPSTWAILLLGAAGTGLALRRARRAVQPA
jgi:hypothetical protein